MATVFEDVSIKGLRPAHFTQLLEYINEREKECWYYGNKEQFEKRHEALTAYENPTKSK